MDNFYLKKNEDWIDKLKYGYVEGENKNLVNRLGDSREEHSELSIFTDILSFKKTVPQPKRATTKALYITFHTDPIKKSSGKRWPSKGVACFLSFLNELKTT